MDQVTRLKAEIARLEAELADLEAEVLDMERGLAEFVSRYNRLIKPMLIRLDVIKAAIADLESQQHTPPPTPESTWTPPPGYVPVEEQFRRVWRQPDRDDTPRPLDSAWTPPPDYVPVEEQFRRTWQRPPRESGPPPEEMFRQIAGDGQPTKELKQLYRQLVRRYHPDLTTDPAERERRHRLMVEINDAYAQRQIELLQSLAAQAGGADEPLAAIYLRQLQQIYSQLEQRVADLKSRRADLLHGEMMWLKIQETLLARRGRDLLREMANDLERDYRALMARLDALRR